MSRREGMQNGEGLLKKCEKGGYSIEQDPRPSTLILGRGGTKRMGPKKKLTKRVRGQSGGRSSPRTSHHMDRMR